jgi:hypothetical protein
VDQETIAEVLDIKPCKAQKQIRITDLLSVIVKCEYVEHTVAITHRSTDDRDDHAITYTWSD